MASTDEKITLSLVFKGGDSAKLIDATGKSIINLGKTAADATKGVGALKAKLDRAVSAMSDVAGQAARMKTATSTMRGGLKELQASIDLAGSGFVDATKHIAGLVNSLYAGAGELDKFGAKVKNAANFGPMLKQLEAVNAKVRKALDPSAIDPFVKKLGRLVEKGALTDKQASNLMKSHQALQNRFTAVAKSLATLEKRMGTAQARVEGLQKSSKVLADRQYKMVAALADLDAVIQREGKNLGVLQEKMNAVHLANQRVEASVKEVSTATTVAGNEFRSLGTTVDRTANKINAASNKIRASLRAMSPIAGVAAPGQVDLGWVNEMRARQSAGAAAGASASAMNRFRLHARAAGNESQQASRKVLLLKGSLGALKTAAGSVNLGSPFRAMGASIRRVTFLMFRLSAAYFMVRQAMMAVSRASEFLTRGFIQQKEFEEQRKRLQINIQLLKQIQVATDLTSTSMADAQVAIKALNRSIDRAAVADVNAYNVALSKVLGKDRIKDIREGKVEINELFRSLAQFFKAERGPGALEMLTRLGGRGAFKLMPIFEVFARDDFQQIIFLMEELGQGFGETSKEMRRNAAVAEEIAFSWGQLRRVLDGMVNQLNIGMGPAVLVASDYLRMFLSTLGMAGRGQGTIHNFGEKIGVGLILFTERIADAIDKYKEIFSGQGLGAAAQSFAGDAGAYLGAALANVVGVAVPAGLALGVEFFSAFLTGIKQAATENPATAVILSALVGIEAAKFIRGPAEKLAKNVSTWYALALGKEMAKGHKMTAFQTAIQGALLKPMPIAAPVSAMNVPKTQATGWVASIAAALGGAIPKIAMLIKNPIVLAVVAGMSLGLLNPQNFSQVSHGFAEMFGRMLVSSIAFIAGTIKTAFQNIFELLFPSFIEGGQTLITAFVDGVGKGFEEAGFQEFGKWMQDQAQNMRDQNVTREKAYQAQRLENLDNYIDNLERRRDEVKEIDDELDVASPEMTESGSWKVLESLRLTGEPSRHSQLLYGMPKRSGDGVGAGYAAKAFFQENFGIGGGLMNAAEREKFLQEQEEYINSLEGQRARIQAYLDGEGDHPDKFMEDITEVLAKSNKEYAREHATFAAQFDDRIALLKAQQVALKDFEDQHEFGDSPEDKDNRKLVEGQKTRIAAELQIIDKLKERNAVIVELRQLENDMTKTEKERIESQTDLIAKYVEMTMHVSGTTASMKGFNDELADSKILEDARRDLQKYLSVMQEFSKGGEAGGTAAHLLNMELAMEGTNTEVARGIIHFTALAAAAVKMAASPIIDWMKNVGGLSSTEAETRALKEANRLNLSRAETERLILQYKAESGIKQLENLGKEQRERMGIEAIYQKIKAMGELRDEQLEKDGKRIDVVNEENEAIKKVNEARLKRQQAENATLLAANAQSAIQYELAEVFQNQSISLNGVTQALIRGKVEAQGIKEEFSSAAEYAALMEKWVEKSRTERVDRITSNVREANQAGMRIESYRSQTSGGEIVDPGLAQKIATAEMKAQEDIQEAMLAIDYKKNALLNETRALNEKELYFLETEAQIRDQLKSYIEHNLQVEKATIQNLYEKLATEERIAEVLKDQFEAKESVEKSSALVDEISNLSPVTTGSDSAGAGFNLMMAEAAVESGTILGHLEMMETVSNKTRDNLNQGFIEAAKAAAAMRVDLDVSQARLTAMETTEGTLGEKQAAGDRDANIKAAEIRARQAILAVQEEFGAAEVSLADETENKKKKLKLEGIKEVLEAEKVKYEKIYQMSLAAIDIEERIAKIGKKSPEDRLDNQFDAALKTIEIITPKLGSAGIGRALIVAKAHAAGLRDGLSDTSTIMKYAVIESSKLVTKIGQAEEKTRQKKVGEEAYYASLAKSAQVHENIEASEIRANLARDRAIEQEQLLLAATLLRDQGRIDAAQRLEDLNERRADSLGARGDDAIAEVGAQKTRELERQNDLLEEQLRINERLYNGEIDSNQAKIEAATAVKGITAEYDEQVVRQQRLRILEEEQKKGLLEIGDLMKSTFSQLFDNLLEGGENTGELLIDIGKQWGKAIFESTLESKLDFDNVMKGNFLDLADFGSDAFKQMLDVFTGGGVIGGGAPGTGYVPPANIYGGFPAGTYQNLPMGAPYASGPAPVIGGGARSGVVLNQGSITYGMPAQQGLMGMDTITQTGGAMLIDKGASYMMGGSGLASGATFAQGGLIYSSTGQIISESTGAVVGFHSAGNPAYGYGMSSAAPVPGTQAAGNAPVAAGMGNYILPAAGGALMGSMTLTPMLKDAMGIELQSSGSNAVYQGGRVIGGVAGVAAGAAVGAQVGAGGGAMSAALGAAAATGVAAIVAVVIGALALIIAEAVDHTLTTGTRKRMEIAKYLNEEFDKGELKKYGAYFDPEKTGELVSDPNLTFEQALASPLNRREQWQDRWDKEARGDAAGTFTEAEVRQMVGMGTGIGAVMARTLEKGRDEKGVHALSTGYLWAENFSEGLKKGLSVEDSLRTAGEALVEFADLHGIDVVDIIGNLAIAREDMVAAFNDDSDSIVGALTKEEKAFRAYGDTVAATMMAFEKTAPKGTHMALAAVESLMKGGQRKVVGSEDPRVGGYPGLPPGDTYFIEGVGGITVPGDLIETSELEYAFEDLTMAEKDAILTMIDDFENLSDFFAEMSRRGFDIEPGEFQRRLEAASASAEFLGERLTALFEATSGKELTAKINLEMIEFAGDTVKGAMLGGLLDQTAIATSFAPVMDLLSYVTTDDESKKVDLLDADQRAYFFALMDDSIASSKENLEEYIPLMDDLIAATFELDQALFEASFDANALMESINVISSIAKDPISQALKKKDASSVSSDIVTKAQEDADQIYAQGLAGEFSMEEGTLAQARADYMRVVKDATADGTVKAWEQWNIDVAERKYLKLAKEHGDQVEENVERGIKDGGEAGWAEVETMREAAQGVLTSGISSAAAAGLAELAASGDVDSAMKVFSETFSANIAASIVQGVIDGLILSQIVQSKEFQDKKSELDLLTQAAVDPRSRGGMDVTEEERAEIRLVMKELSNIALDKLDELRPVFTMFFEDIGSIFGTDLNSQVESINGKEVTVNGTIQWANGPAPAPASDPVRELRFGGKVAGAANGGLFQRGKAVVGEAGKPELVEALPQGGFSVTPLTYNEADDLMKGRSYPGLAMGSRRVSPRTTGVTTVGDEARREDHIRSMIAADLVFGGMIGQAFGGALSSVFGLSPTSIYETPSERRRRAQSGGGGGGGGGGGAPGDGRFGTYRHKLGYCYDDKTKACEDDDNCATWCVFEGEGDELDEMATSVHPWGYFDAGTVFARTANREHVLAYPPGHGYPQYHPGMEWPPPSVLSHVEKPGPYDTGDRVEGPLAGAATGGTFAGPLATAGAGSSSPIAGMAFGGVMSSGGASLGGGTSFGGGGPIMGLADGTPGPRKHTTPPPGGSNPGFPDRQGAREVEVNVSVNMFGDQGADKGKEFAKEFAKVMKDNVKNSLAEAVQDAFMESSTVVAADKAMKGILDKAFALTEDVLAGKVSPEEAAAQFEDFAGDMEAEIDKMAEKAEMLAPIFEKLALDQSYDVNINLQGTLESYAKSLDYGELRENINNAVFEATVSALIAAMLVSGPLADAMNLFKDTMSELLEEAYETGEIDTEAMAEAGKALGDSIQTGMELAAPAFKALGDSLGISIGNSDIGGILGNAVDSAFTERDGFKNFIKNAKQALFEHVRAGLIDAFIQAAIVKGALAPVFTAMNALIKEMVDNEFKMTKELEVKKLQVKASALKALGVLESKEFQAMMSMYMGMIAEIGNAIGADIFPVKDAADDLSDAADSACGTNCDVTHMLREVELGLGQLTKGGEAGSAKVEFYEPIVRTERKERDDGGGGGGGGDGGGTWWDPGGGFDSVGVAFADLIEKMKAAMLEFDLEGEGSLSIFEELFADIGAAISVGSANIQEGPLQEIALLFENFGGSLTGGLDSLTEVFGDDFGKMFEQVEEQLGPLSELTYDSLDDLFAIFRAGLTEAEGFPGITDEAAQALATLFFTFDQGLVDIASLEGMGAEGIEGLLAALRDGLGGLPELSAQAKEDATNFNSELYKALEDGIIRTGELTALAETNLGALAKEMGDGLEELIGLTGVAGMSLDSISEALSGGLIDIGDLDGVASEGLIGILQNIEAGLVDVSAIAGSADIPLKDLAAYLGVGLEAVQEASDDAALATDGAEAGLDDVATSSENLSTQAGWAAASLINLTNHIGDLGEQAGFITGMGGNRAIPKMGTGGIVTTPRLAIVGDTPEAIIPLDNLGSMVGGGGGGGGTSGVAQAIMEMNEKLEALAAAIESQPIETQVTVDRKVLIEAVGDSGRLAKKARRKLL